MCLRYMSQVFEYKMTEKQASNFTTKTFKLYLPKKQFKKLTEKVSSTGLTEEEYIQNLLVTDIRKGRKQ